MQKITKIAKRKKGKLKKRNIFIFFVFILLLFPFFSFSRPLEVDYPFIGEDSLTTETSLGDYINLLFELLIRTGVILAFVIIVVFGVIYMLSPANPQIAHSARNRIYNAFFGVLIVIGAYLFLRIVDPEFAVLRTLEITKTPPVIIDTPPPVEMEDINISPSPPEYKGVIATEIPIGNLIKNIFEFDYPGQEEEQGRMERIKSIARDIASSTEALIYTNRNIITYLGFYDCDDMSTENHHSPLEARRFVEDFFPARFLSVKRDHEKIVKELEEIKKDIEKLENARGLLRNSYLRETDNNFLSLAEYFYFKYALDKDWNIDYVPRLGFEETTGHKSFASFYYPLSGHNTNEFIDKTEEYKNPENYNWCREIPVGDTIELALTLGNKLAERLETLSNLVYVIMGYSISLRDFAFSYDDNICNVAHIPAIYTDPYLMRVVELFPGLLKGPYDSVLLKNVNRLMTVSMEGNTKLTETCSLIYDRDLFYLYNWDYLLSDTPSWFKRPVKENFEFSSFPNKFSYYFSRDLFSFHYMSLDPLFGSISLTQRLQEKHFFPLYYFFLSSKYYLPPSLLNWIFQRFSELPQPSSEDFWLNNWNNWFYTRPPDRFGRQPSISLNDLLSSNWDHINFSFYGREEINIRRYPPVGSYDIDSIVFYPRLNGYYSIRPDIRQLRLAQRSSGEMEKFKLRICERFKDIIDVYSQLYENPEEVYSLCGNMGYPSESPEDIYDRICGSFSHLSLPFPLIVEEDFLTTIQNQEADFPPIVETLERTNFSTSIFLTRVFLSGRVKTLNVRVGDCGWNCFYYIYENHPVSEVGVKLYESEDCSGVQEEISFSGNEIRNNPYFNVRPYVNYPVGIRTDGHLDFSIPIRKKINYPLLAWQNEDEVVNLSYGETYSYKAYAENSLGRSYGECKKFVVPPKDPYIGILEAPENYILEEGIKDIIFFGTDDYQEPLPTLPKKPSTFEQIGLIYLIDNIIPDFSTFFEEAVEKPMEGCVSREGEKPTALLSCRSSQGLLYPVGMSINRCLWRRTGHLYYAVYSNEEEDGQEIQKFQLGQPFYSCFSQCGFANFFRKEYDYLYPYYPPYQEEGLALSKNFNRCLERCLKFENNLQGDPYYDYNNIYFLNANNFSFSHTRLIGSHPLNFFCCYGR